MAHQQELFFSGSKEEWKKYLSNFTNYDKQSTYPSVEAQFQAMKFCYSDHPEHRLQIRWRDLTPAECRRCGSKSYFRKHKITLDIGRWENDKVKIMHELLRMRYHRDKKFRDILSFVKKNKIRLAHFSLRDRFWGCFRKKESGELVGKNTLGKLMHKLINEYY